MTQLTDARKTINVKLPSYPDVEVVLYDGFLAGAADELNQSIDNHDRGIKIMRLLMKTWSFVDAEEKTLPITLENLKLLPMKDFTTLMQAVEDVMKVEEGKKKKS